MDITAANLNAASVTRELEWLNQVISNRMAGYLEAGDHETDPALLLPPDLTTDESVFAKVLKYYKMSVSERIVLALALAPHVCPQLLDRFFIKNSTYDRVFTEFGGIKGIVHNGFIPTGETAAFVIAGNDFAKRFELLPVFGDDHFLRKFNILRLEPSQPNEPQLSGVLTVSHEYLNFFTSGEGYKPGYSTNFPAKRSHTKLEWADLVLDEIVFDEVNDIRDWIEHGETLMSEWGLQNKVKPGFRALFYGPPGTGKTLTATLLGKAAGMEVYRIDLSMIVSKYIGETEKNLSMVFDQAENKRWILFFDEADALFGKRTQTSSSNDRYANQEVSYLLQRIEEFPGLVILSTNLKANIDEAFSRRFQSMIYFPMPGPAHRRILWEQSFSHKTTLDPKVNLTEIAQKYELAGGAIINVVRYCTMKALKRGDQVIMREDIINGIRREFEKDGKTVN